MIAIQKLIANAVDYAGLFPPAALPMSETVSNFASYRRNAGRGMLGRLVVPLNRLQDMRQRIDELPIDSEADGEPWRVSALVPVDAENEFHQLQQALSEIETFNGNYSSDQPISTVVDSIELKFGSSAELSKLTNLIPSNLDSYFEIDCVSDPASAIETLARLRQATDHLSNGNNGGTTGGAGHLFAKIRTGSVIADQIPSVEQVSRFVAACARMFVPFKATAGLHHPIRNEYRLTYEADSSCGTMHGFVNMFVASLCAFEYQLSEQEIAQILQEREAGNFHFEDDRIQWRQFTISVDRIDQLRQQSIQSFGSCSFVEPTEELCELYQCQLS
jgi:hypothetical protein